MKFFLLIIFGVISAVWAEEVPTTIPEYDYEFDDYCDPLSKDLSSTPTAQKAWNKCREYQDKYVFPCRLDKFGPIGHDLHCGHYDENILSATWRVNNREFTHRVRLGYTTEQNVTDGSCEGSLISDKFVLTAAQCIRDTSGNDVKFALVGPVGPLTEQYSIKRIIPHADYNPANGNHDIALLELDRSIPAIDTRMRAIPACLYVGGDENEAFIYATGASNANYTLQRVILKKFPADKCREYDEKTQMCYGEPIMKKDRPCRAVVGSPLQFKSSEISCTFAIVGVTTQGGQCGDIYPGIYTRVFNYLPWIESVAWP